MMMSVTMRLSMKFHGTRVQFSYSSNLRTGEEFKVELMTEQAIGCSANVLE